MTNFLIRAAKIIFAFFVLVTSPLFVFVVFLPIDRCFGERNTVGYYFGVMWEGVKDLYAGKSL